MRPIALTLPLILLGGCASRGAMTFDCRLDGQMAYAYVAPKSQLLSGIEDDQRGSEMELAPAAGPLDAALDGLFAEEAKETGNRAPKNVLLLSGGGQWGAYGAGFLQWLGRERAKAKPNPLPHFDIVTGISTGALQAVFMGALDTPGGARTQPLDALAAGYAPTSEKEVVERGRLLSAIFSGSVAGLKPLRARIEDALCPPTSVADNPCPAMKSLAASDTQTFVGFVDAETGQFLISSINDIAKYGGRPASVSSPPGQLPLNWRRARDCLTGVTIASSAVPVFYQQVRIDGKIKSNDTTIPPGPRTMYDGGVRHSVFEVAIADRIEAAEKRALGGKKVTPLQQPALYVLRNGPTKALPETKVQTTADALTAAQRGYSLLVNQSEVASIEALRLVRPTGPIYFTTADGYDKSNLNDPAPPPSTLPTTDPWQRPVQNTASGCLKPVKGQMFDPEFMRCLQSFGRSKADRERPWSPLPSILPKAK
jgi:predicted acylesterase/phospholipase RssA